MHSPIFDSIVARRDATPIFESVSGSFPAWGGPDGHRTEHGRDGLGERGPRHLGHQRGGADGTGAARS